MISITLALSGCASSKKSDEQILEELASQDKQTIFDTAEELYQQKKYSEARKYFSFVYDTFPTDSEMLARIRQGNPGYDIVVPSATVVYLMIDDGLLLPLPK